MRTISEIAYEIQEDWKKPYFGAVPYIHAMKFLKNIDDMFDLDSAEEIVLRFLGNAKTWRGENARRIKAELNAMLKR